MADATARPVTIRSGGIPVCPFCGTTPKVVNVPASPDDDAELEQVAYCENERCPIYREHVSIAAWCTRVVPPGAMLGTVPMAVSEGFVFAPDDAVALGGLQGRFMLVPLTHGNGG